MELVRQGGVEGQKPESAVEYEYRCPMDNGVRDTPGPCPVCGMTLDEKFKVPKKEATGERTIYVCDLHPDKVFEKPGQCFEGACAGMQLEPRKIVAGSRLVYLCPSHPDAESDSPGVCPVEGCGKKLAFKIVSEATRLVEEWLCPLHPLQTAEGKLACPECGSEMNHLELEQVLAIPTSAVVDTGTRKIVYVDRGHGTFEGVEVVLGPRSGDYFPVQKGLAAGDRVVTAGAFLVDAEAHLNPAAAAAFFGASGQEANK